MTHIATLIAEAIFVGIYTTILYAILYILLPTSIIPTIMLYFYLGFYKHLLAYYIGIHNYYCNNGYACQGPQSKALGDYILIDSILEGILFIIICTVAMSKKINPYLNMFMIGILLHLFAEFTQIHAMFCRYRCISTMPQKST